MEYKKLDIIVVSSKGQVVIPQAVREKLGIKPQTKLLVYGYKDAVIMKKIEVPNIEEELENIYKKVEGRIARYGELADEEIEKIIQEYRKRKSSSA
ncbi:MAG: AbrB/MazE/SpoVT family DNA-binding domain-containing protein [Nitrososphaeria archaeon]|nr:AbrB/MazE/SpoVT family DNA-binding domain-containing protein [Nitrososphaeria archaeon]